VSWSAPAKLPAAPQDGGELPFQSRRSPDRRRSSQSWSPFALHGPHQGAADLDRGGARSPRQLGHGLVGRCGPPAGALALTASEIRKVGAPASIKGGRVELNDFEIATWAPACQANRNPSRWPGPRYGGCSRKWPPAAVASTRPGAAASAPAGHREPADPGSGPVRPEFQRAGRPWRCLPARAPLASRSRASPGLRRVRSWHAAPGGWLWAALQAWCSDLHC